MRVPTTVGSKWHQLFRLVITTQAAWSFVGNAITLRKYVSKARQSSLNSQHVISQQISCTFSRSLREVILSHEHYSKQNRALKAPYKYYRVLILGFCNERAGIWPAYRVRVSIPTLSGAEFTPFFFQKRREIVLTFYHSSLTEHRRARAEFALGRQECVSVIRICKSPPHMAI